AATAAPARTHGAAAASTYAASFEPRAPCPTRTSGARPADAGSSRRALTRSPRLVYSKCDSRAGASAAAAARGRQSGASGSASSRRKRSEKRTAREGRAVLAGEQEPPRPVQVRLHRVLALPRLARDLLDRAVLEVVQLEELPLLRREVARDRGLDALEALGALVHRMRVRLALQR